MKRVNLICVGRLKEKFFKDGADEYAKRLQRFCDLKITELEDFADAGAAKKESDLILSAISALFGSKNPDFWLLDIGGKQPDSTQFAEILDRQFMTAPVTFVIGGSHGVTDQIKSMANKKISFGAFTYPHQLMRVMLLEQVYRAFTITANLPYHK